MRLTWLWERGMARMAGEGVIRRLKGLVCVVQSGEEVSRIGTLAAFRQSERAERRALKAAASGSTRERKRKGRIGGGGDAVV